MSSEAITRNDLEEILNEVLPQKPTRISFQYVSNVGSAIYNNTWTATDDGMMVIVCQWNNGHAGGYWYIKDVETNEYVCTISTDYTNQYREGASFPVIKGHRYNSPDKNAVHGASAFFYKFVIE